MADNVPPGSLAHYRRMQLLTLFGIQLLLDAWRGAASQPNTEEAKNFWLETVADLAAEFTQLQEQAAWSGIFANAAALAQQDAYEAPMYWANPEAFVGYSSVTGLDLAQQFARLGIAYLERAETDTIIDEQIERWLTTIGHGIISDAARDAVQADVITRPKIAFVRMLNPPSCDLCIMLAGQIYWRDPSFADRERGGAFDRHDNCDCIHVPVADSVSLAEHYANGMIDDPYAYFNSLDEAEQNRIFSRARAQALRDGADIYSVMGSSDYRMQTFAGDNYVRRTGLTTWSMTRLDADRNPTRLTPKGIYLTADGDRELALRLLKEHGYIIDRRTISGTEQARQVVQPWQPKHSGSYGPGGAGKRFPDSEYQKLWEQGNGFYESELGRALQEAAARFKAQQAQRIAEAETRDRATDLG